MQRRALLRCLLAHPPAAGERTIADLRPDLEVLLVIGATLGHDRIGRRAETGLLRQLLEHALVVLLVAKLQRALDVGLHVTQHEGARCLGTAIEVDRANQALEEPGQDALGKLLHADHALADGHHPVEPRFAHQLRAHLAADEVRLELGEVTLKAIGIALIQVLADDLAEHGIAQELEAFVARHARVADRRMRERKTHERSVGEAVADQRESIVMLRGA